MDREFLIGEIRRAIAQCGGVAGSGQIRLRLRKNGVKVNQHTVLKLLAIPRFELTDRGWRPELRQVGLFEDLEVGELEVVRNGPGN